MLLIYQVICGALALLVAAVVLRPNAPDARAPRDRGGRIRLQVTGALVLVPLLLRLFLVK